jgi:hypothetical protein
MKTPTVDELIFIAIKELGNNAPDINCTYCGKPIAKKLESGWMTEIPVNNEGEWIIVLCSDECLHEFQGKGKFPKWKVNAFIKERLNTMEKSI